MTSHKATTHRRRPTRALAGVAAVAVAAGIAAGCSDSKPAAASAYCDAARRWAIHELQPVNEEDPAAFKTYWGEYLKFVDQGVRLSPKDINPDWKLVSTALQPFTGVLTKYDFNIQAVMEKGTDAEKSTSEPPPDAKQAQSDILQYESAVCGSQEPQAAEVDFSGEKPGPYCDAVKKGDERAHKVIEEGADPQAMRALATSDEFSKDIDNVRSAAPPVIAADATALATWVREKQLPALAKYGYDMRKLLLEGTVDDRAALNKSAPSIRDHYARTLAYEQQVCGLGS